MKRITRLIISLFIINLMGCASPYKGKVSDHYDGSQFYHQEPDFTFSDMIKWMWTMNPAKWPEWIEDPKYPAPPKRVNNGKYRITHINHATMLIQTDGLNILTDPIWAERSSPVSWMGPKRVRAPGISMDDLPPIDIILISHNHYDHLDIPSIQNIATKNTRILVGLGVGDLLKSEGFKNVEEMDWWNVKSADNLNITFVPARHNSGRGVFDKNKTLWGGFVIEAPAGRLYFAGDTAFGEFLKPIKDKFNSFKVALLPIGSYKPRWMMKTHHMNPDDAVMMHKYFDVEQSIGMHYGTFGGHNDEQVDEHEVDLNTALQEHKINESEFWLLGFGEGRELP